ncbi:hypothetical protein [Sphingosinicella sp. LY1275]|uniref:hypothetical protein n=1 Tax=Sphingosinicella sp. LY1275 TaxID=3095379 RepID=UPI002ADEB29C|nr:hypothetical protein [Sphingosinicella sp. LY1275]MEA1015523.1 hypothetical protein [Sphingosinicella sp. LY1275]
MPDGTDRGEAAPNAEISWLLGQPHLSDYLDFVRHKVVGGRTMDAGTLADEWRAANDIYYELEQSEAGIADAAECLPLHPRLEPLAQALKANSYYRTTFDTLPTTIAMVELDKLIVSQTHIANRFSEARARLLGAQPDPETLFHFCLPLERDNPEVRIQRLASDRYLFSSPSTDLRAHEPTLLGQDQIANIASFGPIAGVIGLIVGFGSNFLTAIRSDNRLVLHNGYHRAYALRALGITHAPCIVETVTRKDELRVAASETVSEDPEFYFRAARPPLLQDFFDMRLAKRLQVRPMETAVEVEFKMRSWTTTDWSE